MARLAGSNGKATAKAIHKHSLELIARHGFAAVSMRMIADAVGVQPGALYQYHPTKQALLLDIMQKHLEALLKAWAKEKESETELPAIEALERFARFHIRYNIKRPDEVFIAYMELRSLEPEEFKLIEELRRQYEDELKTIIANGIKENSFKVEDAHVTAMATLAMLTGINTWYRTGGRLSQKKIEDIYVNMVLRSVGCAKD
ncbi:MAG: TetR family transcriptional regulator [Rhizobiales bacterium]|nr:TetR family transcriptional regulator [Hyphomicrobiales bacterium]